MQKGLSILFLCIFSTALFANQFVTGKIVKIKDGDTFVLLLQNKSQMTIRLAYIDCPEKGQDFYQKAKDFTSQMIAGSNIRCEILKKEKYQRYLAIAYLPDNTSLNELLVRKGWAWVYTEYNKDALMAILQKKAQTEKLGIWQSPKNIPPWEFRRKKKQ